MEKLEPKSATKKSSDSLEKLAKKYWKYSDSKWELRKVIKHELYKSNSVFLDSKEASVWKEQKRQQFVDLVQDDTTLDRVIDRLCEQLPRFLEQKKEYKLDPNNFVNSIILERSKLEDLSPNIINQLAYREKITVSFKHPPEIIVFVGGQYDLHMLHSGKLENFIINGWVDRTAIWLDRSNESKSRTLIHEQFHFESALQSIKTEQYSYWGVNMDEGVEVTLAKKIGMYTNGGLMMEELLANFVQNQVFGEWQSKNYLINYINNPGYSKFEDIPYYQTVLNYLTKIRLEIQNSLNTFLPIVMEHTGLSESESRKYIGNALSVYYDSSANTNDEDCAKRIIKRRNIPKILSIMAGNIPKSNPKNLCDALKRFAKMYR